MARKYTALVQPINLEFLTNQMNALQKAYDELQEAISALALEASAVGSMIGPADGKVWDDYQRYMLGILDETDRFNATGLNPTSRLAIFNLRNQYATEVLPIKSAITRRQQAIDDFNKSPEGKSPLYIGNRPSDTSVDEWMNGATPLIDGIDGSSLLSYVSLEVKNASDRHYRYYTDNGYLIKKIGTSLEETAQLMDAIRGGYNFDSNTAQGAYMNDVLNDIRQSVIKNAGMVFGLNRFAGTPYERQIGSIIEGGIYTGMAGKEERSVDLWAMHEDDQAFLRWKMNLEHAWDIDPNNPKNRGNGKDGNNKDEEPLGYAENVHTLLYKGSKSNLGALKSGMKSFNQPLNIKLRNGKTVTFDNEFELQQYRNSLLNSIEEEDRQYKGLLKPLVTTGSGGPGNSISSLSYTLRSLDLQLLLKEAIVKKWERQHYDTEELNKVSWLKKTKLQKDLEFFDDLLKDIGYEGDKDLYKKVLKEMGLPTDRSANAVEISDFLDKNEYSVYEYPLVTIASGTSLDNTLKRLASDIKVGVRGREDTGIYKVDSNNHIDKDKKQKITKDALYTMLDKITSVDIAPLTIVTDKPYLLVSGKINDSEVTVAVPYEYFNDNVVAEIERLRNRYGADLYDRPVIRYDENVRPVFSIAAANIRSAMEKTISHEATNTEIKNK